MNPNSIPVGYRSITPYLKLPNSGLLVEFLKKAFDGIERGRLLRPDGTLLHAEVLIGDSLVMVHEAPDQWMAKPSSLYLYVEDVDATYTACHGGRGRLLNRASGHVLWRPCGMCQGCVGE
jgi:uncharacterized glyoxalase superfamily protein PhnB